MIRNVSDYTEFDRLTTGAQKAPNVKTALNKAIKMFENSPTQWDISDVKFVETPFTVPCVGEFLHFMLKFRSIQNPDIEFVYRMNPTVVSGESSLYGKHSSQWRRRIQNTLYAEMLTSFPMVKAMANRVNLNQETY